MKNLFLPFKNNNFSDSSCFMLRSSEACGVMQALEVAFPYGREPFLIIVVGEVGYNHDEVARDVALLYLHLHKIISLVIPHPSEQGRLQFFYHRGSPRFMVPPWHTPSELHDVAVSFHVVGYPFSQTFRCADQRPDNFRGTRVELMLENNLFLSIAVNSLRVCKEILLQI